MPGPRADYECKQCQATYDDLPITSTRCPVCGFKRGFRRLFNRVNVATGGGSSLEPHVNASDRVQIDSLIQPMLMQRDVLRSARQAQETGNRQMRERIAAANVPIAPELPQQAVGAPRMTGGPGQLLGMISPASRDTSRSLNLGVLSGLRQMGKPTPLVVGSDPSGAGILAQAQQAARAAERG